MPLTEWRYLKALPNLGLLFNVTSRGGSCRRDTCVCHAAAERKGKTSLLSCHSLDLFLTVDLGLLRAVNPLGSFVVSPGPSVLHSVPSHTPLTAWPSGEEKGCFVFGMWT